MRPGVCRLLACVLVLFAIAAPAAAQVTRQAYSGDRLAYVSGGKLYVGLPHARLVPGPGNAFQPVFSYDGQWLAFLRQRLNGYVASSQLWLARADGGAAHPVTSTGGIFVDGFQWSPSRDVLTVHVQSTKGKPLPIRLIPVQGPVRTVPNNLQGSFLWSPDGQTLAIATSLDGYARISSVSGARVRSYLVPGIRRYDRVLLAGWWPARHGILYWIDPMGSGSLGADGMRLLVLDLGTGTARRLGITLGYRDWIAVSGTRLLAVTGGPRSAFYGKHLTLCLATGPCKTLLRNRPGQITLDPAWAPEGGWNSGAMLFVVAPAWNVWGFDSSKQYLHWLDAHVLWTAQADGSGARPVGGIPKGVQDPEWTRDGRGILFVKDGALWGDEHLGAANAVLIARLVPSFKKSGFQNLYYGHMNWHDLFAWY